MIGSEVQSLMAGTGATTKVTATKMDSLLRTWCKSEGPEDQPPPARAWAFGVGRGGMERRALPTHALCILRPSDAQLAALALRHGPEVESLELHLRLMSVFGASAAIIVPGLKIRPRFWGTSITVSQPVGDAKRQQLFAVSSEFRDEIHLNDATPQGWSWAPRTKANPA